MTLHLAHSCFGCSGVTCPGLTQPTASSSPTCRCESAHSRSAGQKGWTRAPRLSTSRGTPKRVWTLRLVLVDHRSSHLFLLASNDHVSLSSVRSASLSRMQGSIVSSQFKKLENSVTPAGKPFSMKDFSEQEVLGASTPTVGQTNLSQWRREVGTEDLRTCWIDADETGSRLKSWRDVVLESTQETFPDSIVSGPATALTVCRQMFQTRGDPKEMVRQVGQGTVCRA